MLQNLQIQLHWSTKRLIPLTKFLLDRVPSQQHLELGYGTNKGIISAKVSVFSSSCENIHSGVIPTRTPARFLVLRLNVSSCKTSVPARTKKNSVREAPAAARTMHDFCFTYPYGLVVLVGGFIGFLRKGSATSLLGGAGSGVLLLLAGYVSHQAYLKGSKSAFALILETVVTLALTWVMGQRFWQTGKVMPAGIVAALSGVMAVFYLYKVATGGNHIVQQNPIIVQKDPVVKKES